MSFTSVLKKIGQVFNSAEKAVPAYGQLALLATALTPNTKDDEIVAKGLAIANDGLVRFQNIIVDAEIVGQALGMPGSQKAAAAAPAILQLFLDLPIIKGKKPKDPAQSKLDAAELGGALAKFMNGFEG
jgi:hypothetical protein